MTIRIERSIDDPIVSFTFEGDLDPESVRATDVKAGQLLQEMGTFYAIIDIRGTQITFGEVMALLQSFEISDSRVKFVFVGPPVLHDPTKPSGDPVFENKDQAISQRMARIRRRLN